MSRWNAETQERARAIVACYPQRRSAVMPLLYLAMLEEGCVSDGGMREVAEWTGLTPAQVQAVASFYTMYKRRIPGRYLISVCASISCHLLGAEEVIAAIEDETGVAVGETGSDGLFSVERVECIGACGGAVAVQVNYELVEGVTPEKARELCRWLRQNRPEPIRSDVLQELFGGQRSFDWGDGEREGAVAPVPAFRPYGSSAEEPA
jgi:NADH-quinone oxidoreductase subunit E